jgi:hypothetical protein
MRGNRRVANATPVVVLREIKGEYYAVGMPRKEWRKLCARAVAPHTFSAGMACMNAIFVLWCRIALDDSFISLFALTWFFCLVHALYGWRYRTEKAFSIIEDYMEHGGFCD